MGNILCTGGSFLGGYIEKKKVERKKRMEQGNWNKNKSSGTGVNDEKKRREKRREKLSKKRLR